MQHGILHALAQEKALQPLAAFAGAHCYERTCLATFVVVRSLESFSRTFFFCDYRNFLDYFQQTLTYGQVKAKQLTMYEIEN